MMPLPPPAAHTPDGKPPGPLIPELPATLTPPTTPYGAAKPAVTTPSAPCSNRAYPWLLVLSTAIAALFCLMYITKPVILTFPAPPAAVATLPATPLKAAALKAAPAAAKPATAGLLPDASHLPGERSPGAANRPAPAPASPPMNSGYEETNLRIQHVLTAQAPGGHLARIDLEVPVLYQSRSLRWTPEEIATARSLLARLTDYQEKSQRLRAEGGDLLDAWNRLISRSLPATELRADSPSLPTNQQDSAESPRPAGLNTNESIQIQPAGK